jgi:hypothetical protein
MAPLNLNTAPLRTRPSLPMRGGAAPHYTPTRGLHLDRRSRFDVRASKRWGDPSLFRIPTPWLWLEDGCVPTLVGPPICGTPPIADLWP